MLTEIDFFRGIIYTALFNSQNGGIDYRCFLCMKYMKCMGFILAEAEQTLDLVRPSLNDAKLLGIDAGTPVMLFQSLTYDTDGRAIEFNRNYVRGDKCNFNVQFSDKR